MHRAFLNDFLLHSNFKINQPKTKYCPILITKRFSTEWSISRSAEFSVLYDFSAFLLISIISWMYKTVTNTASKNYLLILFYFF